MPFRSKLPPGGLVAAVEAELRQNERQQTLPIAEHVGELAKTAERFKTVRLAAEDYVGADKSASNCPTSRAIRRALGKAPEVSINVWVDRVRIGRHCYVLPAEVTAADRAFTHDGTVTELEFQLSNRPCVLISCDQKNP